MVRCSIKQGKFYVLYFYAMKMYGGFVVNLQALLTSELDENQHHAPAALPSGKGSPLPNSQETGWNP
jgi:hypothetical protein